MPYRKLVCALAVLGAGALSLPAGAGAADLQICVRPATGCAESHTHDTIEQAVEDANDDPERDTIRLGAMTYTPTPTTEFTINTLVDIVGAGIGATILDSPDTVHSWTIHLVTSGSTIKNLSVRLADQTEYGLVLNGGVAEDVSIFADDRPVRNDKGLLLNTGNSTVRRVSIDLPFGTTNNDWAVWAFQGINTVEDSTLSGDNALVQRIGTINLTRSRLTGHRTYVITDNATATIDTAVVRALPGSTDLPIALQAWTTGAGHSALNVNATTVIGNGTGEGARAHNFACGSGGSATVNLNGTTVSGFATASNQVSGTVAGCTAASFATTCDAPAPNSNNVQWTNAHAEANMAVTGGCRGFANSRGGEPGFVSDADLRPRQPSPLIDGGAADPDAGGETDFAGRPRVVDGDAASGARRDIGAFEYQRQAPSVSASVNPASGQLSQVFSFSATGSDPDGESLTFIWDFSDGAATLGASVDKSFSRLGGHSGTVHATDTAGLTTKSTANVTVVPAPTPTRTPTPTPDTTGPAVTVSGGSVKVSKRRKAKIRISCPATEPAACRISIAASSAKKVALKGRRKKISALGKGSGSVAPGKRSTVTITLTKSAYRYLRRKKRLAARLAVTAMDAAGNRARASARVTFRR